MRKQTIPVICFAVMLFSQDNFAQCHEPTQTRLYLGPGIMNCCKHFKLNHTSKHQLDVGVNEGDKNFEVTKEWINQKIYRSINSEIGKKPDPEPNYTLVLFADKLPTKEVEEAVQSMLLAIPLDADTLGADYEEKVGELRGLMHGS